MATVGLVLVSKFRLLAPEDTCTPLKHITKGRFGCVTQLLSHTHRETHPRTHTMENLDLMTLRELHNTINPVTTHVTLIYERVHVDEA